MKHFSSVQWTELMPPVQFRCQGTTNKSLTFTSHTALETPEQSTSDAIELLELLLLSKNL